jgi:asparagine synthase (glutamine-hydrolysing)
MCGIIGASGSLALQDLDGAVAALRHRGPDDTGIFVDPAAGIRLGHARLSIQDVSHLGHQPMRSADGNVVIVFNGEIYNFRELRVELESLGHQFIGSSDTEVLLALYLQMGERMLSRLNGIFAFAIWDARQGSLLMARDALGVKPLYVTELADGVAFASEVKALLRLTPVSRELDREAIARYMTFLWCPGEGTPLRAVRKVRPGEALEVRDGRIVRRWAWYRPAILDDAVRPMNADEAIRSVESGLRRAVDRQLVADVPVGAFLSGGLDSSAVAAFARESIPGLRCFTIEAVNADADGHVDDLPYARRVAAHLGVQLDVVSVDAGRMARDIPMLVRQLDEPLADPAALNVMYIASLARENGIKVLLSGAGGDDLFTGYRRHRAIQAERYWRWMPASLRRSLSAVGAGLDQRRPTLRRLTKLLAGFELEGDARVVQYFRWNDAAVVASALAPGFRPAAEPEVTNREMLDYLVGSAASNGSLRRMLALEQRFFLSDHNLLYTDKMSMAVGVETRVPFLDPDLVALAASMPTQLLQRGAIGKWVLKKAMERHLPHDVIYRPKSGFGAPVRRWMRFDLREMLADILSPARVEARGIFSAEGVAALIRNNDSGACDASYLLLSMLCMELWCREYVDRQACA